MPAKCGKKATTIPACRARRRRRPCSTGTTASGATCRGGRAGAHARSLSGLAVRDHAAADHGQGGHPLLRAFLARWPTVEALAAATLDDVLAAWAGLGYYSRARNLHKCAQVVAGEHGRPLPGNGGGPARAAGHRPLHGGGDRGHRLRRARHAGRRQHRAGGGAAVRGERRRCRPPSPRSGALPRTLTPARRAGDFAQALMDLGAGICTPKRPSCLMCPLQGDCAAHARGLESALPARAAQARAAGARRARLPGAARGRRTCCCGGARRRGCSAACWRCPPPTGPRRCPRSTRRCARRRCAAEWWAVPGVVTPHLHALPAGVAGLSRAGAGRRGAHLLGRPAALPLGAPPRPRPRRAAQRHAQDHRARLAGDVTRMLGCAKRVTQHDVGRSRCWVTRGASLERHRCRWCPR